MRKTAATTGCRFPFRSPERRTPSSGELYASKMLQQATIVVRPVRAPGAPGFRAPGDLVLLLRLLSSSPGGKP
jgi:hypothetical protein